MVQLSYPYMTTGKIIALTIWTFVGKVVLLLFDTLSRFVTDACSLEGKFLISWLQSLSAVTLEPKKIKVCHCFHFPPIYLPMKWWDWMLWSSSSECWVLSQLFTLLFHFHQEALQFLFTFCHKGGVICLSEVVDISLNNLDSSLGFIQPSILYDVLCM